MRVLLAVTAAAVTLAPAPCARAQTALSAHDVVALARAASPAARVAATRVAESRGRLRTARALAQDNPTLEGLRSHGIDPASTTLELAVPLGGGLRRARRISAADADVAREVQLASSEQQRAVAVALHAYYGVLHAREVLALSEERVRLATALGTAAEERYRQGAAARLDVLAAGTERSLARSEELVARSALTGARTGLAVALGRAADPPLEVTGSLDDRSLLEAGIASPPPDHPLVLAARAELRSARAEASVASLGFLPDVAFRLNYERTGGDGEFLPGLALTLPVFDRGDGAHGVVQAREERAAALLEGQEAEIRAEIARARSAYGDLTDACTEVDEHALPQALEVESLAREAYDAGKLDLPSVLLIQGQSLAVRRERIDRLFDAARAAIELAEALGSLPNE